MTTSTPNFGGSIPHLYHELLGPLLFEAYAKDLAVRLRALAPTRLLELACGTGIATLAIAKALPQATSIVATDLNPPMLDVAREVLQAADPAVPSSVAFSAVDACSLPFPDGAFDALACQFGVMFFHDKVHAMQEARRVLTPGGRYIFSVWDSLVHNPMTRVVHETAVAAFPTNPPDFYARLPFGWFDRAVIERVARAGGFSNVTLETLRFDSVAPTAADAAKALIDGTPLSAALAERGMTDLTPLRSATRAALAHAFGEAPCRSTMQAVIATAW